MFDVSLAQFLCISDENWPNDMPFTETCMG